MYIAKSFIHCYVNFFYYRMNILETSYTYTLCLGKYSWSLVILEIEVSLNSWDGEILKECCLDSINCDRSKRVCQRFVHIELIIDIDCDYSVSHSDIRKTDIIFVVLV